MHDDGMDITALMARFALVERRCARLRSALAGGLALVACLALASPAGYGFLAARSAKGIVRAREIVLRDPHGVVRADLGPRADGGVALVLSDATGSPRTILGLGSDGVPALGLSDGAKHLRAAFAVAADGAAHVAFFDEAEHTRATLGLEGVGVPALTLVDGAQRAGAVLQAGGDGASLLRLLDRSGKPRVALGLVRDAPSLVMLDADGSILSRTPDAEQ